MKFTAQELTEWDGHQDAGTSGWIPARPDGWKIEGLLNRIHNAWKVITGDYDVVDWYSFRRTETSTISVVVPSQLHRDTVNLVWQFSSAMAKKLRKSELKYGMIINGKIATGLMNAENSYSITLIKVTR